MGLKAGSRKSDAVVASLLSARLGPDWHLVWHKHVPRIIGLVQPTPMSDSYKVSIAVKDGEPDVTILAPQLLVSKGQFIEVHMYGPQKPCLYRPDADDWNPVNEKFPSIVTWLSEWLFFYELWLSTGEWLGGGEHPRERGASFAT